MKKCPTKSMRKEKKLKRDKEKKLSEFRMSDKMK
jgi:hypothetical protein